ncbi:MAG: TldD/PmbA family protein [Candidatus Heimdallarchaeota archaeon]
MNLGKLAVDKALELGMDEAEAYIERVKVVNAEHAEEIQSYKVVESLGLGIRVAHGKQLGLHATTILTKAEVITAVEKAVKIAKVTPEDPNFNGFNQVIGSAKVEGTYDKTLSELEYDKIADTIIGGINKATEDNRKVKVTRGNLSIFDVDTAITSSYFDTISRQETYVASYMMTKAIEGGDSTGFKSQQVRTWRELDYDLIATKSAEQALKYVHSKSIESIKLPVIMTNDFFASILGLMLGSNVNSENNQKGRSTFSTNFDERFTCIDDGLMKGGLRTRPFDCEGHALQQTPLIENGVLKNFIYDNYRANKENVKSTGNARREYYQLPKPSLNNLVVKPGTTSLEDMIKDTKKGFLIDRTIGQWLSRPASGELNATVTHGYLIENGELTQPVNNVILAGNFFDIMKNKLETIGKDVDNSNFIYTPSIKVSEMTIAGK